MNGHTIAHLEMPERMTQITIRDILDRVSTALSSDADAIILNMSRVEQIDAAGLSIIISTARRMREKDREIVVTNARPNVLALLELTRVHQIVDIFDSADAASSFLRRDRAQVALRIA